MRKKGRECQAFHMLPSLGVWCILWCLQSTKLFCYCLVSPFQHNPTHARLKAVKILFCYLCGTTGYMLCYQVGDTRLSGFIDAYWSGYLDEHKSKSAYAFLLNGVVISSSSKKQLADGCLPWSHNIFYPRQLFSKLYVLEESYKVLEWYRML